MKTSLVTIDEEVVGQRLDNFLIRHLKGVPKARIYRALRKGEVRVNKGRVKQDYRLQQGDQVRIPPLRVSEPTQAPKPHAGMASMLEQRILYEDASLLIMAKPAGMPVHGGSGISMGLIEALRAIRPKQKLLELVHRLDRDTSGCLLIAKKRALLVALHELLTHRKVVKQYLALVKGHWPDDVKEVNEPLRKNILRSGERIVTVTDEGKPAATKFRVLKKYKNATLVEAKPLTGRTHQIRVHAAVMGHPIAGDEKYGDAEFNKRMRHLGLKRLFLHAAGIRFKLPDQNINVCNALDEDLIRAITRLQSEKV
ncbi:23S rRNA pseudouridine(955/2504/2580) synthase RluC [Candidiatus Paracoxiella cheracis]|uniref:23S rRNA pseudouridine(955/2504/2580) synthase RluC n=1 Tax=Candidiatus Paracoxiella cheracis TaxID=3405120 RepID=UPI003BF5546E